MYESHLLCSVHISLCYVCFAAAISESCASMAMALVVHSESTCSSSTVAVASYGTGTCIVHDSSTSSV